MTHHDTGEFGNVPLWHTSTNQKKARAHTQTHTSYPVMESRRPVWSFWEVVDSIVTSVTWIQEQTDVLDVVLYRRFHPLCWEGHDYTHKQTIAEESCLTSKVHLFVIMLNHFHFVHRLKGITSNVIFHHEKSKSRFYIRYYAYLLFWRWCMKYPGPLWHSWKRN